MRTGRRQHTRVGTDYWDIAAAIGGHGEEAFTTDGESSGEAFLAQAVSRL